MKIVKLLFYLSAAAFLLGQLVSFSAPNYPEVRVLFLDIIVGLLAGTWLLLRGIRGIGEIGGIRGVSKSILLFIGIAVVSIVVSAGAYGKEQLVIGSLYLVRFAAYSGLFFAVRDLLKAKLLKTSDLSFLLIAVGIGSGILGIIQYFLYPNLRNLAYLGWDPHYKRLFGTFLDPQFAGAVLVLTAILLLGRIRQNRANRAYIFLALIVVALLLTYSRSSYLAILGGLTALGKRKLAILAVLALLVLGLIRPEGIGGDLLRRDTAYSRISSWKEAVNVWKGRPILGAGFNMYRYARGGSERARIKRMFKNKTDRAGAGVDNSFLFALSTTGILGLLAYLRIWREIIKRAQTKHAQANITKSIITALFMHALFNNALFYPHIMWWTFIYFSPRRESS